LTPFDELVLEMTMRKVQAWERLNDREYCANLKMGEYYDLMIQAGATPENAQSAANRRGFKRLEMGLLM
jgi:hypothetical protein